MSGLNTRFHRLSEGDLDFILETISLKVVDKMKLKMIIRKDEDFRNRFIGDERVFRRLDESLPNLPDPPREFPTGQKTIKFHC